MHLLTLIASIVFIGYAVLVRIPQPEVIGDTDNLEVSPTPQTSPMASISLKSSPRSSPVTGKSNIDIKVDTKLDNTVSGSEKIVYPGAKSIGGNIYETDADGDAVYEWYKSELGKRSYQIRNNVRTKANEMFKAILQGVSNSVSIKVMIDQENASAKTKIVIE
jgi:hypothetical protein